MAMKARIKTSKLYFDARCFGGVVEYASRDRAAWSAGERAALNQIGGQGIAPVIRMKRRWFYTTGA